MKNPEYLCPSCEKKFVSINNELEKCLLASVNLEGDSLNWLEDLEELRLFLSSFLRPEVLNKLLILKKELDKEPRYTEMYSWFVRNSKYGAECKYAINALRQFKEKRVEIVKKMLGDCLKQMSNL
jgi:hypothetical protein